MYGTVPTGKSFHRSATLLTSTITTGFIGGQNASMLLHSLAAAAKDHG